MPDADDHTWDDTLDPRSLWPPGPNWPPHTTIHSRPAMPTAEDAPGSSWRTRRSAALPASAWPPRASARWASGLDTEAKGRMPSPTWAGWSPAPAALGSADL